MKKKTQLDAWIPGVVKAANVRHNYVGISQRSRCGKTTRPVDAEPVSVKDADPRNCTRCQLMKIRNEVAE